MSTPKTNVTITYPETLDKVLKLKNVNDYIIRFNDIKKLDKASEPINPEKKNNKFIKASVIEREKTVKFLTSQGVDINDIYFTKVEGFERFDGIYKSSKGIWVMFEVKVRDVASTTYPTTLIEKSKHIHLNRCRLTMDFLPMVIVFFTDNKVMCRNISIGKVTYTQKRAPRTTMGYSEYILKEFAEYEVNINKLYDFK